MTKEASSASIIRLIPIDRIEVINPRVRNKRSFDEIVKNIADIGLKKPITVNQIEDGDTPRYELVCGQGRLEAYKSLGQSEIPALVIRAEREDCLIRSLVENCARRRHSAIDIFRGISGLKERGYSETEIAAKTGLSYVYIRDICRLLAKGEQRLLSAVESGDMPLWIAVEIANSDDLGVQKALSQAYEKKVLRGSKLITVKRILDQRRRIGKGIHSTPRSGARQGNLTSTTLIKAYNQDADRKRLLIRKASHTRDKLIFITQALKKLFEDENFVTLLRAEGLHSLPRNLTDKMERAGTP